MSRQIKRLLNLGTKEVRIYKVAKNKYILCYQESVYLGDAESIKNKVEKIIGGEKDD